MDNTHIIQGYNPVVGSLTRSQKHKVKEILARDCIERAGRFSFIIKPIEGYNKTTYRVYKDFAWSKWKCNCQFYTQTGRECAHIAAVREFIKRWDEEGQGKLF